MEFCLKWVHMGRYELILRLDGALWLPIIFKPLLTPKRAITIQFESYFWLFVTEKVSMTWNVRAGMAGLWGGSLTNNEANLARGQEGRGEMSSIDWIRVYPSLLPSCIKGPLITICNC